MGCWILLGNQNSHPRLGKVCKRSPGCFTSSAPVSKSWRYSYNYMYTVCLIFYNSKRDLDAHCNSIFSNFLLSVYELQTWCKIQCNYVVCSLGNKLILVLYMHLVILVFQAIWLVFYLWVMSIIHLLTTWIMHNKQNGPQKHFASVSKSEILRTQEDAIPGNTKRATEFHLKVFKG